MLIKVLEPQPWQGATDPGEFTYKGYVVDNCGQKGASMMHIIDSTISALQLASQDAQLGIRGVHGFKELFNTDENIQFVTTLLGNIIAGAPVPLPNLTRRPHTLPPKIVCVSTDMRYNLILFSEEISVYDACTKDAGIIAFQSGLWQAIFLCPVFFDLPETPSGSQCPDVNVQDNEWTGNRSAFADYQSYVLAHELIHLYAKDALGSSTDPNASFA